MASARIGIWVGGLLASALACNRDFHDVSAGAQVHCPAGTADCNGDALDGCEADLTNDREHCGGCAKACDVGPHATATCQGGACTLACEQGYGDCDGNPKTGCEADVRIDPAHCGGCDKA